jgi:hypothetical protein
MEMAAFKALTINLYIDVLSILINKIPKQQSL